jgi:hypothetical protein
VHGRTSPYRQTGSSPPTGCSGNSSCLRTGRRRGGCSGLFTLPVSRAPASADRLGDRGRV